MAPKKRPAMPGAGRKPRADKRAVICLSIRLTDTELAQLDGARAGQARAAYARESLLRRLAAPVATTPERVVDWLRDAVEVAGDVVDVVGEIRRGTP